MRATSAQPAGALKKRVLRDAAVVLALTVAFAVASLHFDLPGVLSRPLLQVVLVLAFSHLLMIVFGQRRSVELKAEAESRRMAEEELRYRARHDSLTGLLNRATIVEEIDDALGDAENAQVAVVLLDLSRFKEVNDTLGHHIGDALLQSVGSRLSDELDEGAVLARPGGNEFVVLLPAGNSTKAQETAERILRAIRRPFTIDGLTLEVDGSCGVADAGDTAIDLLRRADLAMHAAKADHLGVLTYHPALDSSAPERLASFGELRRAIRDGDLVVHYQPKVAMHEGRVVGMEALVRWRHPERGTVPPALFITLAEQTGLIRPLTTVVLRRALADCAHWREQGLDLTVAVNLSARSLLDDALPEQVAEALREHRLPPACLELEITESSAMQDPARALGVLRRLRALGLHLSIDDYGTGHASLAYLTRLPVSTLKIDRSFVQTMELDASDRTIVRSTVDLAHSLGLVVVAEGVETRATWEELIRLGCDQAQGYWLARPAPTGELPAVVGEIEQRLALLGSTIRPLSG